jgi:long-chain acyl-CoA synthetase
MATFYDRFRECAQRWPQNVALEIQHRGGVESYTYAETQRMAECVARWLTENGFEAGSRLAILADNHPRWVVAFLGAIAAGCTAVPLDTAFRPKQVSKLLKDSGSSLIFCDRKHLPVAEEASGDVSILLLDGTGEDARPPMPEANAGRSARATQAVADFDSIFAAAPATFTPIAVPAEAIASLLYTSGTTADPKGVMLTHGNLMAEAAAVCALLKIGPGDAVLGVLPLFHALAQMANLLLPLVAGARVVYLETLNTTELLRALREREITAFAVVPQFFYLIHERIFKEVAQRGQAAQWALRTMMAITRFARRFGLNPGKILFRPIHQMFGSRMRFLVTGGSRFEPQVGHDFHALGIDLLQAYGLTETTGGAFVTLPGDNVIGSVGPPLPGVEARIVNPRPQEEGGPAVGEVAIRGPIVMKGYWNRSDATAAVLCDGWLHTGDIGYFDQRGNLFLTGRMKEVIVLSNGKNLYPEEIEAHYLKSPYIKEVCILGLEGKPGEGVTDRLHGVVVPNFEVLKERKIVNAKEVLRFDIEGLSVQLPSTKRILSYEIWQEELPRTTTRKLKRFEIEKRVRAGKARGDAGELPAERPLSAEDLAWLEQADVQRALQIVREAAKTAPESIRPADNLELDLGLDSMQRVELLVALEEALGGDVEESRIAEIYSVRELVDAVRESSAAGKRGAPSRAQFAGWKTILAEDLTDPEVLAVTGPRPIRDHFLYLLSRLGQVFSLDRFDLRVTGIENLPARGPYLICSNHQSFLDALVLITVLPWPVFQKLFAVGTSDIFATGLMRRVAHLLRVVVVDPDANLIPAMRAGAYGLRQGRILMLYPEGERSIDGTPKTFKKGAAILSTHLQVPIIPVAIDGFHEAWPRGKPFQKFAPLRIAFGEPIDPPPEADGSEATYAALTAELRARVMAMWEELRGERA